MAKRFRLDETLVARGLAPSRARARDAILRGCVLVDEAPATRPGRPVGADARIVVDDPALRWVSRAALKLEAGLEAFDVDVAGRVCLDLGASTGGFTQVLLARGARRVHAVDVGHGQLDPRLAADPRVRSLEGLNVRALVPTHVGEPVEVVVCDVSFVSLRLALPAALPLTTAPASLVALVKPQFELGRAALGKGGIVRDAEAGAHAAATIAEWLDGQGWSPLGIVASPVAGGDGNREYLLGARRG